MKTIKIVSKQIEENSSFLHTIHFCQEFLLVYYNTQYSQIKLANLREGKT